MIEGLEHRRLFATLSGVAFADADTSATFDSGEAGLKGWSAFIDANRNGRFDTGETSVATDKKGHYAFDGLAAGDYLVGVVPAVATMGQTTPGRFGSSQSGFDIELSENTPMTAVERRAFAEAAARWESIITGDLPNASGVDDVRIDVTFDDIDGDGGTLAQSEPTKFRVGSDLPYAGEMEFDTSDIASQIAEGHFVDTITHEMAHVLGFGTIWDDKHLIQDEGSRNPRFVGPTATKEYDRLFGVKESSVPVESRGGDGTADSHWPERTFVEELMTGYDEDAGTPEPLSRITAAQFADEGYTVDLDAADTWNPLTHTTVVTTPLDLGAKAFERRVTVAKKETKADLDFGYRDDTAPTIRGFTAGNAVLGAPVALSASRVTDAQGDAVAGVSFWRESNGVAGLQGGRHGDTYVATAATARDGAFTASAPTAGLAAGSQTYYAVASDTLGLSSRRSGVVTLTAPPAPVRPNPVVGVAQSRTAARLQWRDRSDDEIGFRVELFTDAAYETRASAFNVPADSVMALLSGLTHGTTYYARVRAYGYGGASAYTRAGPFRV